MDGEEEVEWKEKVEANDTTIIGHYGAGG